MPLSGHPCPSQPHACRDVPILRLQTLPPSPELRQGSGPCPRGQDRIMCYLPLIPLAEQDQAGALKPGSWKPVPWTLLWPWGITKHGPGSPRPASSPRVPASPSQSQHLLGPRDCPASSGTQPFQSQTQPQSRYTVTSLGAPCPSSSRLTAASGVRPGGVQMHVLPGHQPGWGRHSSSSPSPPRGFGVCPVVPRARGSKVSHLSRRTQGVSRSPRT